jgi:hypothetical protein
MWYLQKKKKISNTLKFFLFLILEIILNWFQNLFTQSVHLNENKLFFKTEVKNVLFHENDHA